MDICKYAASTCVLILVLEILKVKHYPVVLDTFSPQFPFIGEQIFLRLLLES